MNRGRPALSPSPQFGAHLAHLREEAGLTQKQLAAKIGVPLSNITFWERGNKPPRSEVLPAMAEALDVEIDVLLQSKPAKPRKAVAKGRLQQVFEQASHLPRRQQEKILDVIQPFLKEHLQSANGH